MSLKRMDSGYEGRPQADDESIPMYETARSISSAPLPAKQNDKKDDERISLFWRVFGGTIFSIVALIAITLYNNLTTTINDLRNDLSRMRETRTTLSQKEEVDKTVRVLYERLRAVEGYKVDIEGIKERVAAAGAATEAAKKDLGMSVDGLKKEASGIEVLKERITTLETLKKDVAGLDALKDKLASMTADLKAARTDATKVQQELEKNKAADLERKSSHEAQAKQLDETLKELQKNVQACREKIARLEGAQPNKPSTPKKKDKDSE